MNEAAKRIMTHNAKIRITVAGGGTGIGVQKAGQRLVDIGNTGRALSEEEIAKFGLESFDFAIDGVAPIVHPDNPVKGLTAQQIRDIFAGRITRWSEVGGRWRFLLCAGPGTWPNQRVVPGSGTLYDEYSHSHLRVRIGISLRSADAALV